MFLLDNVRAFSGANPASYSVGNGYSFLRVKQSGSKFDYSPPCMAEVNEWNYISAPPVRPHGEDTDSFTSLHHSVAARKPKTYMFGLVFQKN
jgi:hypothetical protein